MFQFATPVVAATSTSSTSFHQLCSFSAGLAIVLFLSLRKNVLAKNKFETLFVTVSCSCVESLLIILRIVTIWVILPAPAEAPRSVSV